jgi:hypothetical protein
MIFWGDFCFDFLKERNLRIIFFFFGGGGIVGREGGGIGGGGKDDGGITTKVLPWAPLSARPSLCHSLLAAANAFACLRRGQRNLLNNTGTKTN